MHDLGSTKSGDGEILGATLTSLGTLLLTNFDPKEATTSDGPGSMIFSVSSECLPWLYAIVSRVTPDYRGSLSGRLRELAADLGSMELMILTGFVARLERGFEEFVSSAAEASGGTVVLMRRRTNG